MPSRREVIAGVSAVAASLAATPALASIPTLLRRPTEKERRDIVGEGVGDHYKKPEELWRLRAVEHDMVMLAKSRGISFSPRASYASIIDGGLRHIRVDEGGFTCFMIMSHGLQNAS
jgi:hypothetical protein